MEPNAQVRFSPPRATGGGLTPALITAWVGVLFAGAIFGFFYAWVCSTMWGLDEADPRVAIAAMQALAGEERFGPLMKDTPKGDIRHFIPRADAVARMAEPGQPVLILFPRFGAQRAVRPVGQGEAFVRLTQASTNYTMLGERGFSALTRLVQSVPARAIDYMSGADGIALVESLFGEKA
ncbi:MAG TPA: hypothetical protein PLA44_08195 [Propionibacteriaceae bacterium]|nr:hypothetical protein [Propionibacteriaceae bacterium]